MLVEIPDLGAFLIIAALFFGGGLMLYLFSRLRIFNYAYIKNPDDEILINVLIIVDKCSRETPCKL